MKSMEVVTPELISGKRVLLRLDVDVALVRKSDVGDQMSDNRNPNSEIRYQVLEDFRLEAGLPTLELCLKHASHVVVMGHLGRPKGEDLSLSVKPVEEWIRKKLDPVLQKNLEILENLRFDPREESGNLEFAKELAAKGDIFVNESFAAYRSAASTTVLPTLLPHAAGLRFAKEVEVLTRIRENPEHPFVVIMGGAKVADKLPVIKEMAKIADAVLVGGLLPKEISKLQKTQNDSDISEGLRKTQKTSESDNLIIRSSGIPSSSEFFRNLSANVLVGKLNEVGNDIAQETVNAWEGLIKQAKMIFWNGPLGHVEKPGNDQSRKVYEMIKMSGARLVVGGGDIVAYLKTLGVLNEIWYVSTGGGADLNFLATGTLPTIEALS